jgi:hypothetical protein
MSAANFTLSASHEWIAHDPFGKVRTADQPATLPDSAGGAVVLTAARNGYVSFRLLVRGAGEYRLAAKPGGGLEIDLFKAWYHKLHAESGAPAEWWPDALVFVPKRAAFRLPDDDNDVPEQTTQEFWVDVFVPRDATPGEAKGKIDLTAGGQTISLGIRVQVLPQTIPDEPCVVMDYNSYGCRNLTEMYPKAFGRARRGEAHWNKCIEILHNYHRVVREHRGLFHNLGYGHAGSFDPIYGPRTEGSGRTKNIVDWDYYDRHYGPLFDGSAFSKAAPGGPPARQAATPVWSAYTPINPDWPASYLWWGQRGYEVEFTRGMAQFDAHLREKGWTRTYMEFFFNHKKRYRWFEWDGDEVKYYHDMDYHEKMVRMWESVTADSPVRWVYRMDASWHMKKQLREFGGHRNLWVCGGFFRWYPEEVRAALGRPGELMWWYNGTPPVQGGSTEILALPYETWATGMHGNCQWLTNSPGPDPWFDCNGANTGAVYPGERFGIDGPIPSIRMKVLRNGIQDLDLLTQQAKRAGTLEKVRAEVGAGVAIPIWKKPPRVANELPPEDWDGNNLSAEHEPVHEAKKALDPFWWQGIRKRALSQEA